MPRAGGTAPYEQTCDRFDRTLAENRERDRGPKAFRNGKFALSCLGIRKNRSRIGLAGIAQDLSARTHDERQLSRIVVEAIDQCARFGTEAEKSPCEQTLGLSARTPKDFLPLALSDFSCRRQQKIQSWQTVGL